MDAGPGGNIIGINFANDGTAVVRTDTGGSYVNTVANPVWRELITLASMPAGTATFMGDYASGGIHYDGTYAVAVAPSNSNVMYLFTGGNVYASVNKGVTWTATGFTTVAFSGVNGAFDNSFNNKVAVDPQNPLVVVVGCTSGTFYSLDGGATWHQITAAGTGSFSSLIAPDPSSSVVGGVQQGWYVATWGTGVYRSTGGPSGTFSLINTTGMPTQVTQMKVAGDGILYCVANDGTTNVHKYDGTAWSSLNPLPSSHFASGLSLKDVVVDPASNSRVIATFDGGFVSESNDHGATWTGATPGPYTLIANDVPWLATTNHPQFAGATAAFNPALTNTLVLTEGISVWTTGPAALASTSPYTIGNSGNTSFAITSSHNIPPISVGAPINGIEQANGANIFAGSVVSYTPINATSGTLVVNIVFSLGSGAHSDWNVMVGLTWTSQGAGINQLVANWIAVPPGGSAFFNAWDRCGLSLTNGAFPPNQAFINPGGVTTEIVGGWDFDYSYNNPLYMAGIFNSNINPFDTSGFSTDGGKTWAAFGTNTPWGSGAFIAGSMAVACNASSSAAAQNIVWMPAGLGGGGNRPYFTADGGATWTLCTFPAGVPTTGTTGWGGFNTKIKQVCSDRVALNTLYSYNQVTNDVYRSTDGGANWAQRNSVAPSSVGVAILKAVPPLGSQNTTGWLFGFSIAVASDVLSRSKDGGQTWTVVTGFTTVAAMGFGASVNGVVPAYLVVGIRGGVRGVWLSTDDATTWKNVTNNFVSADQIADCDGDKGTAGLWYIATQNTGIFRGTAIA